MAAYPMRSGTSHTGPVAFRFSMAGRWIISGLAGMRYGAAAVSLAVSDAVEWRTGSEPFLVRM